MRTTVSISDELLAAARSRALATGRTLGAVLEAGLRRELSVSTTAGDRPEVPVFRGGTGALPGLDLTSNRALYEALDEGLTLDVRR